MAASYKTWAIDTLYLWQVDQSKQVLSPMPGLVKTINCAPGDMVAEGQELCVIGNSSALQYFAKKYLRSLFYHELCSLSIQLDAARVVF